ncbi:hypothetical protein Hdeb2414_s0008g00294701 [Helianthus debilis subsp. tardiflorus]
MKLVLGVIERETTIFILFISGVFMLISKLIFGCVHASSHVVIFISVVLMLIES